MGNRWAWLLVGLLVVGLASAASTPAELSGIAGYPGIAPNSGEAFSFVVMGDNTGGHEPGRWAHAVDIVNRLRPDFVINVGDVIEGYIENPTAINGMWDDFEAENSQLRSPFFYVAGNHDTTNQVMYDIYRKRHGVDGRAYYSFDYRGCHFVVLAVNDGILRPELLAEQIAWLDGDLAKAKSARHTFVIYHRPARDLKPFWPELVKRLDPAKTTIINGHIHQMSYEVVDGLPVYIMGCTGAGVDADEPGRERLLMQVSFDGGKPDIVVSPADTMQSGERLTKAALGELDRLCQLGLGKLPEGGGDLTVSLANPLAREASVTLSAAGADWACQPATTTVALKAGANLQVKLGLRPTRANPSRLEVSAAFTLPVGEGDELHRTVRQALHPARTMALPKVGKITVDGTLADWGKLAGQKLVERSLVYAGAANWSGPADHSVRLLAGHDGTKLYLAADVADDQISTDASAPWQNDGLELFWDARPAAQRDGKHALGTGQLILPLVGAGDSVKPAWYVGSRPVPEGLVTAARPRPGGYVIELSIPLASLRSGVADDGTLALDFQFNDRDKVGGEAVVSSLSPCGFGEHFQTTSDYAVAKLR